MQVSADVRINYALVVSFPRSYRAFLFPGLSREYLAERPIRVHESTRMGGSLRCAPKVVWSSRQPAGLAGALLPLKAKSVTNGLVALHASWVGGVSELRDHEDLLQRWPVSKRVNSSKAPADDPTLMEEIELYG